MTTTAPPARFASPVDVVRHGGYRLPQQPGDPRPLYRFTGRLTADGSSGFHAEPDRYHLYAGWSCPWAHRVVLEIAVNGLTNVISVSYVDDERDGRGWAFRAVHGPDPVNGFRLLRDAYEVSEPGFDGHVSVPVLWDRTTGRVVSNDFRTLGLDIATQFTGIRWPGIDTYPVHLRAEIEALDAWVGPAVNQGVVGAAGSGSEARRARADLRAALARLDRRLADRAFLVGRGVTEADIRLWVTLVRLDPATLDAYPHLARYTGWLAELPAFRGSTRPPES